MTEFLDDLPAWLIFVVMFSIGMTRSAGYYALGRLSRGRTGSAWAERVARAGGEFLPEAERRVADVSRPMRSIAQRRRPNGRQGRARP